MCAILASKLLDIIWILEKFLNDPFEILASLKDDGLFACKIIFEIFKRRLRLVK